MQPTCLATYSIDRSASVLSEQRSVGPRANDFFECYFAATIDPETQVPVKAVERFRIGQTPLLWFTEDKAGVVVDAAVLSDLAVAEVVHMTSGAIAKIGQVTEHGLGRISGRDLTGFLLHARVIGTYVHIGSELCLLSEETDEDGNYEAHLTGEHTYFTNEENVDPLDFVVRIGAKGLISVHIP